MSLIVEWQVDFYFSDAREERISSYETKPKRVSQTRDHKSLHNGNSRLVRHD